jgi:hypothetical protein
LTLIVTKRKGPLDIPNCRSSGPLFFSLHDYKILHYLVKKEEKPARKKNVKMKKKKKTLREMTPVIFFPADGPKSCGPICTQQTTSTTQTGFFLFILCSPVYSCIISSTWW